ncbi:MAG: NAD(P)/FAD-dependent oxidoreductase [Betaproteobacteria bacterium]
MTPTPLRALIIGAGPAGLTAAHELQRAGSCAITVVEASDDIGGLSRTVDYHGYRMDLGGHRFFSRSDWVMDWWRTMLPLDPQAVAEGATVRLGYRAQQRDLDLAARPTAPGADPDGVLLVRKRLSRIYHRRRFFDYPIRLDLKTIASLGWWRSAAAGFSYVAAQVFPRRPERHLEDFLVNRFGKRLYEAFFKSYTEKVWGVPCTAISVDWGAQRIKGLSLTRALTHAAARALGLERRNAPVSLIEHFLYPKLGPGQLWEEVARRVVASGGTIAMRHRVVRIAMRDGRVVAVDVRDGDTGTVETLPCDYAISSMPVCDLVACMDPPPPAAVRDVAERLPYRDFIVVGLIVRRSVPGALAGGLDLPPDNWIYIQEPDVRLGRLQVMNNWSPALVPDPSTAWLGLEYFCAEGDDLWSLPDPALLALAKRELQQIGIVVAADVLDGVVVRVPKAYPAYVGAYAQFAVVRDWLDAIPNLFLVGRNGMHRYNNQDHSMLTAKAAVDNIVAGRTDKANLWSINVDDDYLEEK